MTELAELKPGDEVAIHAGIGDDYHILKITRIDAKGVIDLENGERYRPDGFPVRRGKFRLDPIELVTDEIRRIIKKNRLVRKLNGLDYNDWKKMDVDVLESVAALIWKTER